LLDADGVEGCLHDAIKKAELRIAITLKVNFIFGNLLRIKLIQVAIIRTAQRNDDGKTSPAEQFTKPTMRLLIFVGVNDHASKK